MTILTNHLVFSTNRYRPPPTGATFLHQPTRRAPLSPGPKAPALPGAETTSFGSQGGGEACYPGRLVRT